MASAGEVVIFGLPFHRLTSIFGPGDACNGVSWRGDRVAEGARLLSECAFPRTVGSNPTLSAKGRSLGK